MIRKSKRELERAIDRLLDDGDDLEDIEVTSSVSVITEEMIDDEGNVDLPAVDTPDGYELGPEYSTESQAVAVHAVTPTTDVDEGENR